jgi:hypothetical protein
MQFYKFTLGSLRKVLWLFMTFGLLLGAGVFVLKFYEDSMRTRERGRLVESIVREQLNSLIKQSEFTASDASSGLPRGKDSIALERWLILKTLNASGDISGMASGNAPENVSGPMSDKDKSGNFQHLTSLLRSLSHEVPNGLRSSVNRWANTCESWADTLAHKEMNLNGLSAHQLLVEGRQRYFEASGFEKIGRSYDAAALNLWTITVLSEFVEKYPYHPEIPEALYMLGDSYLDLGNGLPNQVKADRVLNLCSELYPDSVWASRANAIWQEQYSPQNMSGENRKSLAGLNHAI